MGKKKDPAAVALGRRGGIASGQALTAEERAEKARMASAVRWNGHQYSDSYQARYKRARKAAKAADAAQKKRRQK